jgi:hypothetical protein
MQHSDLCALPSIQQHILLVPAVETTLGQREGIRVGSESSLYDRISEITPSGTSSGDVVRGQGDPEPRRSSKMVEPKGTK